MKYFVIFLVLTGFAVLFLSGNNAYGLWVPQSPQELIEQSETVFVGTIQSVNVLEFERSNEHHVEENGVSKIIVENYTQTLDEYTVSIEEFLKNPQESNTINMLEATVGGVPGRSVSIGGFELDDRVLFYVPKIDGTNQYSPESFKIPKQCDAKSVLEQPRIIGSNDFRMIQNGIPKQDNYTANKKIQFVFDKDLGTLDGAGFNVGVEISKVLDKNEYQTVLKEDIHVESQPCEWIVAAQWDIIPTAGEYLMWMSYGEDGNSGRSTYSGSFSVVENTFDKSTVAKLEWSQFNYAVTNGTGKAKIIVTDPDMNILPNNTDTLDVFVYSDSDREGITLRLYEIEKDIGVFERTFTFSDKRSTPNILHALEGDTVTAQYVDYTLPSDAESESVEMTETMFLGLTGPPLERAPASSARIVDSFGNSINEPAVGEQVQITSDVANGMNREQKFAYIVMIQDDDGIVQSLAWIDGTLNPESSFSPSASWIPQKEGHYVATMFVWESIYNPTALSPTIQIEFTVISEHVKKETQHQDGNYQEMFMFIIPQNKFEQFTDTDLRMLHFYKITAHELSSLPRLGLLVNMTEDFSHVPVSRLGLRISDEQIQQYDLFFEQKCKEQRPYAVSDACLQTDFAFEYDEKWYYTYSKLAPHYDALEDSTSDWDPKYFTRNEN